MVKSVTVLFCCRNVKPSLKMPTPRTTSKSLLEGPKTKSNIPSTGLYRPKPVFGGVGAT